MKHFVAKGTAAAVIAAMSIQVFSFTPFAEENNQDEADVTGTLGFAKVDDEDEDGVINVLAQTDAEEGEVVGYLEDGDSAEILSVEDDGWYKIRSGEVEGYVAQWLIITGDEAQEIADRSRYTYAKVNAGTDVFTSTGEGAEVITTLEEGAEAEVVADYDGGAYVRVCLDADTYGYISADNAVIETAYPTGEPVERDDDTDSDSVDEQEDYYDESADVTYTEAAETSDYSDADLSADNSYESSSSDITAESAYSDTSSTEAAYTESSSSETGYTESAVSETASTEATYTETASTEAASAEAASTETASTETTYTETAPAETTYTESPSSDESYETAETSDTEAGTQAEADSSSASSTGSATGAAIAAYASQFVGNPYVWGGTSLTNGADCSGFTLAVFANFGISLPHDAASQYSCGTPVSTSDLQAGDLVFFSSSGGTIDHVAIYVGSGSIVHAANSSSGICYGSLSYMTVVGACRVV